MANKKLSPIEAAKVFTAKMREEIEKGIGPRKISAKDAYAQLSKSLVNEISLTEENLQKIIKLEKSENKMKKNLFGLPSGPTASKEQLDRKLVKKPMKTVFGVLDEKKLGKRQLEISPPGEKLDDDPALPGAVLPSDKPEKDAAPVARVGVEPKKSPPKKNVFKTLKNNKIEKSMTLGGRDTSSKVMTNHAMIQASREAKNSKMPTQQQEKVKLPSMAEHSQRANMYAEFMPKNELLKQMSDLDRKMAKCGHQRVDPQAKMLSKNSSVFKKKIGVK